MMNEGSLDIESIVREVVRRLLDAQHPVAATATASDELRIEDRVVTLATLDGRLTGIRRIHVPPRAVVTPAVRDYLRDKKIHLNRSAQEVTRPTTKLYLHTTETTFSLSELASRLSALAQVERLVSAPIDQAISELAAVLAGSDARAVLVARQSIAAVWNANQHRHLRAAAACDVESARAAVQEINANLLVIDPSRRLNLPFGSTLETRPTELFKIVCEFVRAGSDLPALR